LENDTAKTKLTLETKNQQVVVNGVERRS